MAATAIAATAKAAQSIETRNGGDDEFFVDMFHYLRMSPNVEMV
jgi:hypothetical protein